MTQADGSNELKVEVVKPGPSRREDHTTSYRRAERAAARRWRAYLGDDADPAEVTVDDLKAFATERASGRLDPRGQRARKPRPVRKRTVEADLKWLKQRARLGGPQRSPSVAAPQG